MKIKSLFFVFIVFIVIMFNLMECSGEKKDFSKELWTMIELHNKLPDDIKDVLNKKELVPWGCFNQRNDNDRILYAKSNIFSPILIIYAKESSINWDKDINMYENNGSTYTEIHLNITIKNLNPKKMAEIIFSADTGKLLEFKLKINENEWITRKPEIKI